MELFSKFKKQYQFMMFVSTIIFCAMSLFLSFMIKTQVYDVIDGTANLVGSSINFEVIGDITVYIPFVLFLIKMVFVTFIYKINNKDINKTKTFIDILFYISIGAIVINLICIIASPGITINEGETIIKKICTISKFINLILHVLFMVFSLPYKFIEEEKESENVIG